MGLFNFILERSLEYVWEIYRCYPVEKVIVMNEKNHNYDFFCKIALLLLKTHS